MVENRLDMLQGRPPFIGNLDAFAHAPVKLKTGVIFQLLQLLRHRRLANAQLLRGFSQARPLCGRLEKFKLIKSDTGPLRWTGCPRIVAAANFAGWI
jgi:hypothetical protein